MDETHRQITKIAREVGKFTARTLRAEGVGVAEFDVLHAVRKHPGITQTGVCEITGIDKGAAARQIANLEAKGYLTRAENPKDGRSRLLYAAQKAETLKNSKACVEALFYEWLLQALSANERQTFARLLDALYRKCKDESKRDFCEMKTIVEDLNGDAET